MRALITDLDRTLTDADLRVSTRTLEAVGRLRAAGTKVVIATGRPLEHLGPLAAHFDGLVAENGAVLSLAGREEVIGGGFADRASSALGVLGREFVWHRVIGSGPVGLSNYVHEALAEAGIGHRVVRNADEVMLLPPGVDKGSGASRMLRLLGVPAAAACAVGDGDNDVDLFHACGRSYAVANASRRAASAADETLTHAYGEGFAELATRMIAGRR